MERSAGRSALGRSGEGTALDHYRRRGYRLVARNWRCHLGEIDLILARGSTLVICEVKARSGIGLGGPYEAVTWKKQRKLRQLAEAFLAARDLEPSAIRFDVASVTVDPSGRLSLHLFEQAF